MEDFKAGEATEISWNLFEISNRDLHCTRSLFFISNADPGFVCLFVLETRSCYVALDSLKLTVLLDQANLELIEIHLPCLPSAEVKGDVLLRLVWGVFFTQNYKHIGFLTNYPAKSIQLVLTNSWQCCDT